MSETSQPAQEIDGVKCFAPALAQAEESYPAEAFERLVALEANSFWFRSRNRIIARIFRRYVRQPARPRVLEIGCGTGFVLSALHAQRCYDLVGAEQHVAGLLWARRRHPDVEFVQVDARALPYRSEFDAVGAFDVLEHIEQDQEVMRACAAPCARTGCSSSRCRSMPGCGARRTSRRVTSGGTRVSNLRAKLERQGFNVRFCTSFVFTLLPLMYASRTRRKPAADRTPATAVELDELELPGVLDRLLSLVMRVDEWLIAAGISLPVGGSLLVVAERADR